MIYDKCLIHSCCEPILAENGLPQALGDLTCADLLPDNPYDFMNQGCDFLRNHSCPAIDFATIHLWADNWLGDADEDRKLQFAQRWITCHVDVCTNLLHKPLVLSEFGKKPPGKVRAAFYEMVRLRWLCPPAMPALPASVQQVSA